MGKEMALGGSPFVVTADTEGKINHWSDRAEELFGWDSSEAVGLHLVKRLFERQYLVKGFGAFREAANGGEWEGQIYGRRRDGSDFPVLLKLAPLLDEGGFTVGVMAVGNVLPQKSMQGVDLDRDYVAYLVSECNLSQLSAFTYLQGEQRIERFTGKEIHQLTVADVRRFLRESPYHPATKNSTLVSVKARLRWMVLEGYIDYSPIQALRGPRQVRNPKPALSRDEAVELLEACHRPNEFRVIWLGLYAGLRISESASIDETSWLPDRLRFEGKGRKVREVPVHPSLATQRDLIICRSTSAGTLKHVCRSLSHYTGIDFTSHALRRTFGVMLSESGVDRDTIGDLLGHAPSSVTVQAYVPVRWHEKVEAVARLSYEIPREEGVLEGEVTKSLTEGANDGPRT